MFNIKAPCLYKQSNLYSLLFIRSFIYKTVFFQNKQCLRKICDIRTSKIKLPKKTLFNPFEHKSAYLNIGRFILAKNIGSLQIDSILADSWYCRAGFPIYAVSAQFACARRVCGFST